MRFFIFSILSILYSRSLSQSNDSTSYKHLLSLKNVARLEYMKTYHNNGQIESEGWLVVEASNANSEIMEITEWQKYDTVTHKIGPWKRFYKNGQLAGLDTFPVFYKNDQSREYYYNRRGCLYKKVILVPSSRIKNLNTRWNGDDYSSISFYHYNCKGIRKEEHFLANFEKTGVWKWYKEGIVVRSKNFPKR